MRLPAVVTALVDAAVDAVAVVDPELRLLHFNRTYARLAGIRERDLRARPFAAMCHQHFGLESCKDQQCAALRALKSHKPVRIDEVSGKGGELRLIVSAIPLEDERGVPYAVMEVYRDVTAESRMQVSYRALLERERQRNELLQEEVRKRTHELEQHVVELRVTRSQLIQSEKMSSLGRLVAGIAHELNNPINFIYGNVEFLEAHVASLLRLLGEAQRLVPEGTARRELEEALEGVDFAFVNEDLTKLLPAIRAGAERAVHIVHGLRTFSHVGTAAFAPCDLRQQIDLALRLVANQAKDRVTVAAEIQPLPLVMCNGPQIGQVVTNLIVNAIDAIPGRGKVIVRASPGPEATVVIEVEDDGCGIPEAAIGKIFEPFFTTKDVGSGTGLGLSISYGIVQAHRGELEVRSELGRGTTFRIVLPIGGAASQSLDPVAEHS
jgi:two-component system NtrC family sensor kinase